jgi:release factor glutamine methyltransferase
VAKGVSAPVCLPDLVRQASQTISRTDAEFLLMSLLDTGRHVLMDKVAASPGLRAGFRRSIDRVRRGEPVQYAAGTAPFLDFAVRVDRRVMIPRPETEELVLRAAGRLEQTGTLALDFGTGSGCIAIALCRLRPLMRVIAADCSPDALSVAAANARRLRVASRIRFVQASSVSDAVLARYRGRLDLLISNPPYIPTARLSRLEPVVREHEPLLALDGGPKGTTIVQMLLEQGPELLKPEGLLALEVDSTHARFLRRGAPGIEIEHDLSGRVRYAFLHRR